MYIVAQIRCLREKRFRGLITRKGVFIYTKRFPLYRLRKFLQLRVGIFDMCDFLQYEHHFDRVINNNLDIKMITLKYETMSKPENIETLSRLGSEAAIGRSKSARRPVTLL